MGQLGNEVQSAAVRQAEIHKRHGGAIDLQMPPRGTQAISPANARARAQAQQAHRLAGKAAVFDHQNGQPQQGARRRGGRGCLRKRIGIVHDRLQQHPYRHGYAALPNDALT